MVTSWTLFDLKVIIKQWLQRICTAYGHVGVIHLPKIDFPTRARYSFSAQIALRQITFLPQKQWSTASVHNQEIVLTKLVWMGLERNNRPFETSFSPLLLILSIKLAPTYWSGMALCLTLTWAWKCALSSPHAPVPVWLSAVYVLFFCLSSYILYLILENLMKKK